MNEQKHLGLVLDSKLSFEKHLNEKIIKANKNLGIIKHLPRFLPLRTLDQMFKVLVRSHLDYCHIIYHVPSKQDQFGVTLSYLMEKVERIQYQAALAITGAWQGSNRSKLYDELGWECLSDRRWCRRTLKLHKIYACTYVHMYACTHVRMYACTHVGMYICTHVHVRMYACTHVRMYACTHVRMYASTRLRIYASTHLRIYASTHLRMYACTHVRMYACTHLRMYACTHLRMYASTHVRMYASTHVRVYAQYNTIIQYNLFISC